MDMEAGALLQLGMKKIKAGEPVMLLEIVSTEGSAPRKPGTLMMLDRSGAEYGTIGGGYAEFLASKEGRELLLQRENDCRRFELRKGKADSIGVCGGTVGVSFTYLGADGAEEQQKSLAYLENERSRQEAGKGILYIFGGGHVALAVSQAASLAGFPFIVYDDREALANRERFPLAKEVIAAPYEEALSRVKIGKTDFVLITTEGHQHDYEMQKQVLTTDACYIGVIGSRTKIAVNNERLRKDGYTETDLNRFYAPVGLPIGAETPGEIGISILAEMILKRATMERREKLMRNGALRLRHD